MKTYQINSLTDDKVLVESVGHNQLFDALSEIGADLATMKFTGTIILYQNNYRGSDNQIFTASVIGNQIEIQDGSFTEHRAEYYKERYAPQERWHYPA